MRFFSSGLVLLSLLLLSLEVMTAQVGSYPIWSGYDSTFYVGADIAANVDTAVDELTIDYSWNYFKTIAGWRSAYYNPQHIGDSSHYDFVTRAYQRGFKIVIGPTELTDLVGNAPVIDAYPGGNSWAMDTSGVRLPPFRVEGAGGVDRDPLDDREVFYTLSSPLDTTAGNQLIAGEPCYTAQAMDVGGADIFEELDTTDFSRQIRVEASLNTDTTSFVFTQVLGFNDTIAYIVLLRRYIDEQSDTCKCKIWERFDTIPVTKGAYLNAPLDPTNGYRDIGAHYGLDSIASSLRGDLPVNPGKKLWFGWSTISEHISPQDTCSRLYATLDSDRYHNGNDVELSDLLFEVWTTNLVPVSLLRGRVNMRLYDLLVEGEADQIITEVVDSMVVDPILDSVTWRVSIVNEIKPLWAYRAFGYVSSRLQQAIADADRSWGIHTNPYQDYGAFRALSGDLDSASTRLIHAMIPQPYLDEIPIPEMYADTARMDSVATEQYFGGLIRFNTLSDYETFTEETASRGKYLDGVAFDNWRGSWTNAVDIARFRYRHFVPSFPVLPSVQAQGFFPKMAGGGPSDVTRTFAQPSPEYAKKQIWYALACGGDGIHLADVSWFGQNTGYIYQRSGAHSADTLEYGALEGFNPATGFKTRKMWLGITSRFDTIASTIRKVRVIDSVVGWKNLHYNQAQMTVSDTRQSFANMPLVDTLIMLAAKRFDTDTLGQFLDSTKYDARDSTYVELTHFSSGPGDTSVSDHGRTHYFLVLNKRIWPLDTRVHDTVNGVPRTRSPFGYIDARRPVMRFENTTSVIADSVRIEGILSGFSDTVAFGELVKLSWLDPGGAELYRVTTLPSGFSEHSTAYNNAVHSENPSRDTLALDRLIVYERDSAIYLRTITPEGTWSPSVLISNPDDTVLVSGSRTASNFFPSIAILRGSEPAPRVVWERDSLGHRSVESAWFPGVTLMTRSTVDSLIAGTGVEISRHRLSIADSLVGPPALTPSIVAVSDAAKQPGFVVSWADHEYGVNALALRAPTVSDSVLQAYDSAGVYRLRSLEIVDSIGQYPTLATAGIQEVVYVPNGVSSGTAPVPVDTLEDPSHSEQLTMVHLAWQQGDGVDGMWESIFYDRIGVDFRTDALIQPTIWASSTIEHVTRSILACSFEHPSIAADSTRVGVAFEIFGNVGSHRNIGLRFRDTVAPDPVTGLPLKAWHTYLYQWGGKLKYHNFSHFGTTEKYIRPSLSHFPSLDSATLGVQPEGGLTWFNENAPSGRRYPQYLYRYGWFEPREIGDGAHPSLTLVAVAGDAPFELSSILHRGDSTSRSLGISDEGDSVWYYSGHLLNTATNPLSGLFGSIPGTGGIVAGVRTFEAGTMHSYCQYARPVFDFGFRFNHADLDHPDDDRSSPGDPDIVTPKPGLPPDLFGQPGSGATMLDDLTMVSKVARTSLFTAPATDSIRVVRYAGVSDSVFAWLDTFGWDSARNSPADIWTVVEVVRASDSAILWRGDTISARDLDTLGAPVNKALWVPVGDVADSGEMVYIRTRSFTSPLVSYDVSGGFTYYTDETPPLVVPKPALRYGEFGNRSRESVLSLAVVPNPMTSGRVSTLHVSSRVTGEIRVSVWDVRGKRLGELPLIEADKVGTWSVQLDLEGLKPGTYIVRAESAGELGVVQVVVQ